MSKYIFVLLFNLFVIGCASTNVFMGNYDVVKIAISDSQARMSAENLPYKAQLPDGKQEKKITEYPVSIIKNDLKNGPCESANLKHRLHVNIVCSDKNLIKEFSDGFYKNGFTIDESFHKPPNGYTTIAEVTIWPKRKGNNGLEGEYYVITFETMGGLSGGTHRILVEDPLAFAFRPANIAADTNEIKVVIIHSRCIEDGKFVVKDGSVLPINVQLQALSEIISTMRKPIRIIFTKM